MISKKITIAAVLIAVLVLVFSTTRRNEPPTEMIVQLNENRNLPFKEIETSTSVGQNPAMFSVKRGEITYTIDSKGVMIESQKGWQRIEADVSSAMWFLAMQPEQKEKAFITNLDFNFDGRSDLALMTSVGYAGVNYFYSIYLASAETLGAPGYYYDTPILQDIGFPKVDGEKKELVSSFRSGPQWEEVRYQFFNGGYVKK